MNKHNRSISSKASKTDNCIISTDNTTSGRIKCTVSLEFSKDDNSEARKRTADLLVTAFEKQIGVKEKT